MKNEFRNSDIIKYEAGVFLPDLSDGNNKIKGIASFSKLVILYTHTIKEPDLKELLDKYSDQPDKKSFQIKKPTDKYGILENEKEVDLHIEKLVPDPSRMPNAEMIQVQMKTFSSEMDNALRNHFKKIIFIHGVGNGKLKNEIRNELRNYPGVAFRDGEFGKYGYGATEVIFVS